MLTLNLTLNPDPNPNAKAAFARDGFSKMIYSRLFDYLVLRVNDALEGAGRVLRVLCTVLHKLTIVKVCVRVFLKNCGNPSEATTNLEYHPIPRRNRIRSEPLNGLFPL